MIQWINERIHITNAYLI